MAFQSRSAWSWLVEQSKFCIGWLLIPNQFTSRQDNQSIQHQVSPWLTIFQVFIIIFLSMMLYRNVQVVFDWWILLWMMQLSLVFFSYLSTSFPFLSLITSCDTFHLLNIIYIWIQCLNLSSAVIRLRCLLLFSFYVLVYLTETSLQDNIYLVLLSSD